jgi:8-oxo-dGTP pyrophosphatase MutT (NUDIX family)
VTTATLFDDELRARVARNVTAFAREAVPHEVVARDGLRASAVAVAIVGDDEGRACFLLTRRAATLKRHAGQWALPGGRLDDGERAHDAALREMREEVGLALDETSVLDALDDYATRSGYVITPVVVWGCARPVLRSDAAEVESIHLVPLDELDKPGVPVFIDGVEPERPVIRVPLYGRFVHAPTGAILYQLREVALHGRATRVAHFDQPEFAWR